ncbi:hypothetical protein HAX54_036548 [Datura stramonium]|uniref:Pentatricopeptide repeat-containing protein n=1 Tax=Datura stramonium TaxID=4076 RepID=A0ABS8SGF4_DATST|nr:hypothetical protein [Datura stramonium]
MCKSEVTPDEFTFSGIVKILGELGDIVSGKIVHGRCVRNGAFLDTVVANSFMVMYSKCEGYMGVKEENLDDKLWDFTKDMQFEGWKFDAFTVSALLLCVGRVELGRRVFDRSKHRNVFAWTAMINGYVLNGDFDEALLLFKAMQREGVEPNKVSLISILPACCSFDRLKGGKQIHAFSTRRGLNHEVSLCNALIDINQVERACIVICWVKQANFDRALDFITFMPTQPGPSIWGALVNASAIHGNSERWDVVARVRTMMKDKGLKKFPGCSWISVNTETHSFYVADKSHPCSVVIYEMVDQLIFSNEAR